VTWPRRAGWRWSVALTTTAPSTAVRRPTATPILRWLRQYVWPFYVSIHLVKRLR